MLCILYSMTNEKEYNMKIIRMESDGADLVKPYANITFILNNSSERNVCGEEFPEGATPERWQEKFATLLKEQYGTEAYFKNIKFKPMCIIWNNTTPADLEKYQLAILKKLIKETNNDLNG